MINMRKLFTICLAAITLMVSAQDLPEHSTSLYVTDLANVFTDSQESQLDKRIRDYKAATTTEFAVATVPTLQGTDVADFTNKLFKKWKIGTSEYNNGMLFLICPAEHKWRIEIGYGLEPFLPDAYTKERGLALLKPNFKQNKFFEGTDLLLADFISKLGNSNFATMQSEYKKTQEELAAEQEAKAERDKAESERASAAFFNGLLWFLGIVGFIGLIVLLVYLDKRRKRLEAEERNRIERAEHERQVRVNALKNQIRELKKFRENTEPRVKAIERFPYDIGQSGMRKIFDTDCDEISREVVELSDYETELKQVVDKLNHIIKESVHALNEFELQIHNVTKIKADINSVPSSISALRSQQQDALVVAKNIQSKYDRSIWGDRLLTPDVSSNLEQAEAAYKSASELLEANKFDAAKTKIEYAKDALTRSNRYIRSPYELKDLLTKCEAAVNKASSDIQSRQSTGERLRRHSDASRSSITKFDNALASARSLSMTGNPILDSAALSVALSNIDAANRSMQSDIDYVESEKKRKEEEERRRKRREQEDEDRRRQSSYSSSSSSSSSWSSSSSCSSSSSSSFGGGDSGGGGSSGDW